jgi:hypothetical protein
MSTASVAVNVAADTRQAEAALEEATRPVVSLIITGAWTLYRRSQEIPFPQTGAGTLMMAQSRLFHLLEPHTNTCASPDREPDLDSVRDAAGHLVTVVRSFCPAADAEFVATGVRR